MIRLLSLCTLLAACNPNPQPEVPPEKCTGFSSTPQSWHIDQPLVYDYFMSSRDGLGRYWSLRDLDNDGFLDLIQHEHGSKAAADAMGDNWYVWWGDGSSFSDRTNYALPLDHREIEGLWAANSTQLVMDINGDGMSDLVRGQDLDTREIWQGSGGRHWRVYLGEGRTGFSSTLTEWTVPDAFDYQVHSSRTSGRAWTTFDIDDDGIVEMVHTTSTDTSHNWGFADGNPHWRVYRNTGTGFEASYEEWPIADSPTSYDGWYDGHTDTAYFTTRTQDVTGDGMPDLIAPRDSAWPSPVWGADTEAPHWRVFANNGDGFDKEWIEWSVPDAQFDFTGSSADWIHETSDIYDTLPIGGGFPALVQAADPETGEGLVDADGKPVWHVYTNTGAGFASEPSTWALPDPLFNRFWASGGAQTGGWTTIDLTGDGCLDLVLTAGLDLPEPEQGLPHTWRVWPGE